MERDSFVFYRSFFEALSCLDKEQKADCLDAIAKYALDGEESDIDGIVKALFVSIKPQIDANNRRYANGCKGGKPKANQSVTKSEPKANQDVTKSEPNENENVNDNENVNVKEKESKKKSADKPHRSFVPPTVEQVREYCQERKRGVDPQAFVDFYASKGWFVGKNKMKDWRAAVRTWEQRSRGQPKSKIEIDNNFRNFIEQNQVIDWETGG